MTERAHDCSSMHMHCKCVLPETLALCSCASDIVSACSQHVVRLWACAVRSATSGRVVTDLVYRNRNS